MQLKQGLESVNGRRLLKFRWQFIPQYTTFILDRPLTKGSIYWIQMRVILWCSQALTTTLYPSLTKTPS